MKKEYFAPVDYLSENPEFPPREEGNYFSVVANSIMFTLAFIGNKWSIVTVEDGELYKQFFMSQLEIGKVIDTVELRDMLEAFRELERDVCRWVNL